MTVPVTALIDTHLTDGAATNFEYSWRIINKTHLKVTKVTIATEAEEVLVLDDDYTVNGVGDETGSIDIAPAQATGYKIVITSNAPEEQPYGFRDQGSVHPDRVEDALDYLATLIKRLSEKVGRAILTNFSDSSTDPNDFLNTILGYKEAAENAADDTANDVITTGNNVSLSQAAALAAQNAVDGIPYRDVVFLTFANSPYTMTNADRGKLFSVDTSGGNFVFNLAQISGLTMPFTVGLKKATNDANTLTINRAGTDLIDAATSYAITSVSGVNLVADTDGTPDKWTSAAFAAGAGEIRNQTFFAGVDFTAGSSNSVTLTNTPIAPSSTALEIYMDGVAQHAGEWTYNPSTGVITFTSSIPSGVGQIFTRWASTAVSIGTPSAGTVDWSKLASGVIANLAQMVAGTANLLVTAAGFKSWLDSIHGCRVYRSTAQSIPNATWTAIQFDAEDFDDATMHDNSTNNTRITVNFTGRILVTGAYGVGTSTNASYGARIVKNGSSTEARDFRQFASGAAEQYNVNVTTIINVVPGDYVELQGYQNSGVSVNCATGANTYLAVQRVK